MLLETPIYDLKLQSHIFFFLFSLTYSLKIFKIIYLLIEMQLIYNVVLISAIQQSDSVTAGSQREESRP